jgi:hypothetical protein
MNPTSIILVDSGSSDAGRDWMTVWMVALCATPLRRKPITASLASLARISFCSCS